MLDVRGLRRRMRRFWGRISTRMKVVLASACAVALAAACFGGYLAGASIFKHDDSCLVSGATKVIHQGAGAECVGITDGSFVFDPSLAAVEHEILRENRRVTSAYPTSYVSVVLLLPISPSSGSILSMSNALEQLRGAYVAQYYSNRNDVDGITPYIQLLIASNGDQANEWAATDDIIEGAAAAQHIDAVTGLGLSLDQTESAAKRLAAAGMPVIGATITSDHFDNIKNLIRVAPSNQDAISVAVSYARARSTRAVLVEDQNKGDTYDSTVVTGFEHYPDAKHRIVGKEPYDTTYRDQAQSPAAEAQAELLLKNRISQMTADICLAQPAAVLFAGRGRDLADLVADLADRPCTDKPITIISGDDVTNLPFSQAVRQGLSSDVTVDYAGVANPGEWSTGTGAAVAEGRQGFAAFEKAFAGLFQGATLDDGNTMMAYDAVLTGISAIRLTSLPQPPQYAVAGELGALHGARTVFGASGPLAFNADYTTSAQGSNPIGKAVPILSLRLDGGSQFVTLRWPGGQPVAY